VLFWKFFLKSCFQVYPFNTFFYTALTGNGYKKVSRWTKNVNIFEYDLLLFPLHLGGNHWCLAVSYFLAVINQHYFRLWTLGKRPWPFLTQWARRRAKFIWRTSCKFLFVSLRLLHLV
jgi:Ulp1 family protease